MDELERLSAELERERAFGHTVTDAIHCPLVVVDADGVIAPGGVNVAAEHLCGYEEAALVGRHFVDVFVTPDDDAAASAWLSEQHADGVELACPSRDGDTRFVTWTVQPLSAAPEPRFLLVGMDVTEWRRHEEELRSSRARIVEAADAERRRLERNLHDGAQQRLVTLSLSLRLLEQRLGHDPEAARVVTQAREELAAALEEVRELARGLHPAVLADHGLVPALDALASRVPIPVELDVEVDGRLPEPAEVTAYYVVSESLANAQKYARASRVRVSAVRRGGALEVEVADDGVGGARAGGGTDLRGLADRLEAVGGQLDVSSPAGGGTRIAAAIPC